jgi:hypothetical protein
MERVKLFYHPVYGYRWEEISPVMGDENVRESKSRRRGIPVIKVKPTGEVWKRQHST